MTHARSDGKDGNGIAVPRFGFDGARAAGLMGDGRESPSR